MKIEERVLDVAEINLDVNNPRSEEAKSQPDAIYAMIKEQGIKLVNLGSDIVSYGLNPSRVFIVFKKGDSYICGDGNRRLTALKLLETPSLSENTDLFKRFKKLSEDSVHSRVDKVKCVVFPDRASMKHWLEIEHGGEQVGKGQIPWDSEQKDRFFGKKSSGLQAKEEILRHKLMSEEELREVYVTTLSRLIDSKPGKEALGIVKKDGAIQFNDLNKLVVAAKALRGRSVGDVYKDDDRKSFLVDIGLRGEQKAKGSSRKKSRKQPKKIFGSELSLRNGIVRDVYLDICDVDDLRKGNKKGRFLEILGVSLRLLLDVAAYEYSLEYPDAELSEDNRYKRFIKLASNRLDQKSKNDLALNQSFKDIVKEDKVEALLAKLAHGSISTDEKMIINLSEIVGKIITEFFQESIE